MVSNQFIKCKEKKQLFSVLRTYNVIAGGLCRHCLSCVEMGRGTFLGNHGGRPYQLCRYIHETLAHVFIISICLPLQTKFSLHRFIFTRKQTWAEYGEKLLNSFPSVPFFQFKSPCPSCLFTSWEEGCNSYFPGSKLF